MKVMLLSYMDNLGAGNAANKIYQMLIKKNINAELYVKKKNLKNSKTFILKNIRKKIHELSFDTFNYISNKLVNNRFYFSDYRSLSWGSSPYPDLINNSNFDIVQLHWINNFLSIKDIGRINKPLVWRFSDMWPILGAKHYLGKKENKDKFSFSNYLEKKNIKQKEKYWKNKINIISPSNWLKSQIKLNYITHDWPTTVIYTPINTDIFFPLDRSKIRAQYNILNHQRVLIFGADNLFDERKGLNKLIDIFKNKIIDQKNEYVLFTFGKGIFKEKKINNLNIINFGFLKNKVEINKLFNAADVLILPSKIDNLPQIGLEAQTSGLPIITFRNSGLEELIEENETGLFSKKEDSISLSNEIYNYFNNSNQNISKFRINSRDRSLSQWSEEVVYKKYIDLYSNILNREN